MRCAALFVMFLPSLLALPTWRWQDLPPLPQAVGGAFAGVLDGQLIVAGGSYWRGAPWIPGSEKIYVDTIYALSRGARRWRSIGRLPAPMGYGASVVHEQSLWLIGGQDKHGARKSIFRISSRGEVSSAGELPEALMMMATAQLGASHYLLGGQPQLRACLRSADLLRWEPCAPWPGPGRFFAQATQSKGTLYLAGGSDLEGSQRTFLRDAYRLDERGWTRLPDLPVPVQAGFAVSRQGMPMILGGSDGSLAAFEAELGADHPGFSSLIWKLAGDRWLPAGRLPYAPVTTTLVEWEDAIVIPGGEDRPAHRSSRVILGKFVDE